MRVHWETSDGILVKDLPRLAKKLSVSIGGVVVLSKGKLVSEAMPNNLNTSEAVGNLLWQLATYGHQLSKATAVAPIANELERAHYMCQNEDDMKKLVTSHDLDSFPLRVARAINQQVIAPAFAFLYSVVDVPAGKPFLDSRNAEKSWTVEVSRFSLHLFVCSIGSFHFLPFPRNTSPCLPQPFQHE